MYCTSAKRLVKRTLDINRIYIFKYCLTNEHTTLHNYLHDDGIVRHKNLKIGNCFKSGIFFLCFYNIYILKFILIKLFYKYVCYIIYFIAFIFKNIHGNKLIEIIYCFIEFFMSLKLEH